MCSVYVLVRPGAKEFLEELAPFYEMVIYTASLSKYADPLMDILDPKGICTARLFREHCTFYSNIFVKDLSKIDRDPKDLLIIDNSPNSYLFQPESALPIVSWYDDMEDTLLYEYIPILQGMSIIDDVRDALAAFVYPNEPMEYDRIDVNKGVELLDRYITRAKEGLIPEYEAKNKTRVFSEPRNFQNNLEADENDEKEPLKPFTQDNQETNSQLHNSAEIKKNSEFTNEILNTWTTNDNKPKEEKKRKTKPSTRPKSGNPSPMKKDPGIDRIYPKNNPYLTNNGPGKPSPSPLVSAKVNPASNITTMFRSYNKPQSSKITPQSGNHPQPHQRNIKKAMMGHTKNNISSDMYRIYGIQKPDGAHHSTQNTPKTSSSKRDPSIFKNKFGIRVNNLMMSNRANQSTSQGNRSVSPNRIAWQDPSDREMFNVTKKTNLVDVLKYQARTNLKSLEKDVNSIISRRKKPTPKHKRVKTNTGGKYPILAVYHPSPLNRNGNQMEGVKGLGYRQATNSFGRHKDSRSVKNKTFSRNQSKKRYKEGNSEIGESYMKSFPGKRVKRKIKRVLKNNTGIPDAFLNQAATRKEL